MGPRSAVKIILTAFMITIILVGSALADDDTSFNYMTADKVREKIETGQKMIILDIQVAEEFNRHHLKGAVATYAYPVKSDEDRAKLGEMFSQISSNGDPVVIVCPRGKGGAKRAYKYLSSKGISEERLYILENGQFGWPYSWLLDES